jgi:hypothetical protein
MQRQDQVPYVGIVGELEQLRRILSRVVVAAFGARFCVGAAVEQRAYDHE